MLPRTAGPTSIFSGSVSSTLPDRGTALQALTVPTLASPKARENLPLSTSKPIFITAVLALLGGLLGLALGGERPVLGLEHAIGRRAVFLVEGVFDYLTALSWKLPAFSPCGTHFPAERLGFLAQAEVIYGVLDSDEAGRAAAARFGEQLGRRFRALHLPDGCDLNDLARRPGGRAMFFHLLATERRAGTTGGRHDR